MPDPRVEALARMVARVEGGACWLARLALRTAVVGGIAGALVWWVTMGDRVDEWWQGTASSLLVLGLCLVPAAWLVNVRFALTDLVELPDKLSGVATRRAGRLKGRPQPDRPDGGALGAARSIWEVVRDYGDVVGSWGTVAQLLAPPFWVLTAVSFVVVPVLVVVAAIAAAVSG